MITPTVKIGPLISMEASNENSLFKRQRSMSSEISQTFKDDAVRIPQVDPFERKSSAPHLPSAEFADIDRVRELGEESNESPVTDDSGNSSDDHSKKEVRGECLVGALHATLVENDSDEKNIGKKRALKKSGEESKAGRPTKNEVRTINMQQSSDLNAVLPKLQNMQVFFLLLVLLFLSSTFT